MDSITDAAMDYIDMANEQPWMYAVTALVMFVPFYLMCCGGGGDADADEVEDKPAAEEKAAEEKAAEAEPATEEEKETEEAEEEKETDQKVEELEEEEE